MVEIKLMRDTDKEGHFVFTVAAGYDDNLCVEGVELPDRSIEDLEAELVTVARRFISKCIIGKWDRWE